MSDKTPGLTINVCNICNTSDFDILAEKDRDGNPLKSVICRKCGLVWTESLPYDPQAFYEKDYRLKYKATYYPKPKHVYRAGKVALDRYNTIKNLLLEKKTILDVGSGGGEFVYLLKTKGHNIIGIEPNIGYLEYSVKELGVTIKSGLIQDIGLPEAQFDIITIWHVLEHTADPAKVLAKLYSLLKPNGILVVEVPNIEAVARSPEARFHMAHIFNFNGRTLEKILHKTNYNIVSISFSEDYGNILAIVKKDATDDNTVETTDTHGNAARITDTVRSDGYAKYYLTPRPYMRLLRRLKRMLIEKIATINYKGGKNCLDKLYSGDN